MQCLVTKHYGSVNNPNILELDAFKITVSKNVSLNKPMVIGYGSYKIKSDYPFIVENVSYAAGTYYSFTGIKEIFMTNDVHKFIIDGKSHITYFRLDANEYGDAANTLNAEYRFIPQYLTRFYCANTNVDLNIEDFTNVQRICCRSRSMSGDITKCTNCKSFSLNYCSVTGDISTISGVNQYLNIRDTLCSGNIVTFLNNNDPENVDISSCTNVEGNIEEVTPRRCQKLSSIYFYNTNISGSLETFANKIYDSGNGRVSGKMTVMGNGIITFNGSPFTGNKIVTFTANGPTY